VETESLHLRNCRDVAIERVITEGVTMKSLLLGAATSLAMVAGASAADMSIKAPPPVWSWTGCYIGGNLGVASARVENIDLTTNPPQSLGSHTAQGGVYGVQVGCDYQTGALVFGLRGLFDGANPTGQNTIPQNAAIAYTTSIPWLGTVTGRAGFTLTPAWLVYAQGGGAFVRDLHAQLNPQPTVFTSGSTTFGGWTVGGGLEYRFAANASGFIEYNYMGFNDIHTCCSPGGAGTITEKFNVQTVMVGLNFRFGGGPVYTKY
jgi:outer membrane immunogenic protein